MNEDMKLSSRIKKPRTVRFLLSPQLEASMQTRSKSSVLRGVSRVVTTRESTDKDEEQPFFFKSAASSWGKEELRLLGVKFHSAPNQRVEDLCQYKGWDSSSWSDGLKRRL